MTANDRTDARSPARRLSAAWPAFEQKLARVLATLEEDQYLILNVKHSNRYVQFAAQGAFGLRAETTSNGFLAKTEVLESRQIEALLALGWQPPTGQAAESTRENAPDGSPNFFCDFPAPLDAAAVARLAVQTLAEILRVPHPRFLEYEAFGDQGQFDLPLLDLKQRSNQDGKSNPEPLQSRLLETLRQATSITDLEYDDDGDIGIRYGSAVIFATIVGDSALVRYYTPLLKDVEESVALLARLNDINARLALAKLVYQNGLIFIVLDLPAQPFQPDPVVRGFRQICAVADGLDDILQAEFGGSLGVPDFPGSVTLH